MISPAAKLVLERRYLLKDEAGRIIETPEELFNRVARTASLGNKSLQDKFEESLSSLEFLPNSPTLMNAGTNLGQLSACFVLPVEDSLSSIFEALKDMALIQQSGGGTGFSFSHLRPQGDVVRTTHGVASGPVSFMSIFNASTDVIKQGGRRRGANMGILSVRHPDIIDFIHAKERGGALTNFNISVAVDDAFMEAVKKNKSYELINPRTGGAVKKTSARKVFDLICQMAWKCGDPGIIFIDEINRKNPLMHLGQIEATNPCGEQPLLPYESCNLGSLNLAKLVKENELDWEKFKERIRLAVEFLDNIIDANHYPVAEIEKMTKGNRKIGLGVMGFAEMLIKLGIRYDTDAALALGEKIAKFLTQTARQRSIEIGEQKGSFINFPGSSWERQGLRALRNSTVTTIAPTGSISLIADCTSGIEPLFALAYTKKVLGGTALTKIFKKEPAVITALEIMPEWHVRMQASFQKYTDNAVSKTVNLPKSAAVKDVKNIFLLAYRLKCKGITVYRYGSKKEQVLYVEDSGEQCCSL